MSDKLREPYIVASDDLDSGLELVIWHQTEDEAIDDFDGMMKGFTYPDWLGRNMHVFKMIKTTGHDLDEEATR